MNCDNAFGNILPGIISFAGIALSGMVHAEVRTWTATDGRTLEAEFLRADNSSVTMRRGGKEFSLTLDKLSEEDKEYVQGRLEAAERFDLSELGDYAKYATGGWVKGEIEGLPFQIHAPADYKAGQPIPLVIFLHGVGERGEDNEKQVNGWPKIFATPENQAKRQCIVVVPQCPSDKYWSNNDVTKQVIEMTEVLTENMPVDESRVYLTGFSMGGYGTWAALGEDPKRFAAAVPIAGGGDPGIARSIKKVPIWNFHGDKDDAVDVSSSRTMVEALEKARGNITYTEFEGAGHQIADRVLKDEKVQQWLFSQRKK